MTLSPVYKSLAVEKEKKSFLKGYHVAIDSINLFFNLEITDFDFETEAQSIAESIVEIVRKHLSEGEEQPLYDRFEESLKEVNFFLNDLKSKKESGDIGKINMVMGVLDDRTLHITKTGLSEAYLLRKGNIIEISEGLYTQKNADPNYFVNIASGDLETGDKVLFCSKRLLKFIPKSDINSIFITSDIESSFQDLKTSLHTEDVGDIIINGFVLEKKEEKRQEAMEEVDESGIGALVKREKRFDWQKAVKRTMRQVGAYASSLPERLKNKEVRRNYLIGLIVIIVVALLLNVTIFSNPKEQNAQLQQYEQTLQMARSLLQDAQQKKLYDVKLAKNSLDEAKKKAFEVAKSGVYYADVKAIMADIEKEEELMDRITRIDNPVIFVDLSKKDQNVDALGLISLNQAFYVMTTNSILGPIIDSSPESYSKTAVENNEILVSGDKFVDRGDIVLLTKSNKVLEYRDNNMTYMDTEDNFWQPAIDVKTYADRKYLYLLDPTNNNIWKYERTIKKYKGAISYNADKVDIKDAVSFAIDGGIYVLKQTGEIKRMYQQKLANLTVEGGPSIPLANLDSHSKIYTNENLRNVYVLDPANERLLVYKKVSFEKTDKLSYDRQYILKGIQLRDVYVDDLEQNIFLLTPQKVIKIEVK